MRTTILSHKLFTYETTRNAKRPWLRHRTEKLSLRREFQTLHESLIKDMVLCGTNDNYLRESSSWI